MFCEGVQTPVNYTLFTFVIQTITHYITPTDKGWEIERKEAYMKEMKFQLPSDFGHISDADYKALWKLAGPIEIKMVEKKEPSGKCGK